MRTAAQRVNTCARWGSADVHGVVIRARKIYAPVRGFASNRDIYDESRFDKTRTLYHRLDLPVEAEAKSIREAYLKKAKDVHPDKRPEDEDAATKEFKGLQEAYATLTHPGKKRIYDMELRFRTAMVDGEEKLKEEQVEKKKNTRIWMVLGIIFGVPIWSAIVFLNTPWLQSRVYHDLSYDQQVKYRQWSEWMAQRKDELERKYLDKRYD